jgi:predicted dehydrogenase
MPKHIVTVLVLWLAAAAAVAADAGTGRKIGVGLYGANGHQLNAGKFSAYPDATLVAVAGLKAPTSAPGVATYGSLDELIADPKVQLVSLCSPRRADQARDAIKCLLAGKHVYAEKPSALTETELDDVLAAARTSGREFHEMAGTVFAADYAALRQLVREGAVGDVIQVFVQKSYRYGKTRPQDEAIDGGLFLQAGVHAARMIEHAAGVRMQTITAWETQQGSPEKGEGRMAAAAQIGLENGGIATIIINYLNPSNPVLPHGNETLRVFGTKGFIESVDGGARTRLVTGTSVVEPLPPVPAADYFNFVAAHLTRGTAMPLTLEEELHPLRILLRAKEQLRARPAPSVAPLPSH